MKLEDYLGEDEDCSLLEIEAEVRRACWELWVLEDLSKTLMLGQVKDRGYLEVRDCGLHDVQLGAGREEGGAGAGRRVRAWRAGQRVAG